MRHGSLFSGIGGFDLAAEWMGWENVFHCEWNPFGQKILKHYWPNAKSYGDITKTDFTEWKGKVDVVSGGFPCQPYSQAGKRKGKADDRHLWPEMLRAIREIQPRWIVGENVPGLLNWQRGMVLDEIKADLEAAGFEIFPSLVLPACGKNAPHRRDRLWIVAHTKNDFSNDEFRNEEQGTRALPEKRFNEFITTTNTGSKRFQRGIFRQQRNVCGQAGTFKRSEPSRTFAEGIEWIEFPTQSPVCSRDDGLSSELDGITISKHRKESLMAYGNAIVPQIAYEIFKSIEEFEKINQGTGR